MHHEKVKVSKEILEAIEKRNYSFETFMQISMEQHRFSDEVGVLNQLSTQELALVLLGHYELQLSPEEEIAEIYFKAKNLGRIEYMDGIERTLSTFGIYVPGINLKPKVEQIKPTPLES